MAPGAGPGLRRKVAYVPPFPTPWEPEAPPPAPVSPGLCRLLNEAAVNSRFRAELLREPYAAALGAVGGGATAFGHPLPDPTLQPPPPDLTARDWAALRQLRPAQALGALWRDLYGLTGQHQHRDDAPEPGGVGSSGASEATGPAGSGRARDLQAAG